MLKIEEMLTANEEQLERMARNMAVSPPPGVWMNAEENNAAKTESGSGNF